MIFFNFSKNKNNLKRRVIKSALLWMIVVTFFAGCTTNTIIDTRLQGTDSRTNKLKNTLWIYGYDFYKHTAFNKTYLTLSFNNMSTKVIKYIHFVYEPKNRVGDSILDLTGQVDYVNLEYIGPLPPNPDNRETYFTEAWETYSIDKTVRTLHLYSVEIEFMDGEIVLVIGNDLKYIANNDLLIMQPKYVYRS